MYYGLIYRTRNSAENNIKKVKNRFDWVFVVVLCYPRPHNLTDTNCDKKQEQYHKTWHDLMTILFQTEQIKIKSLYKSICTHRNINKMYAQHSCFLQKLGTSYHRFTLPAKGERLCQLFVFVRIIMISKSKCACSFYQQLIFPQKEKYYCWGKVLWNLLKVWKKKKKKIQLKKKKKNNTKTCMPYTWDWA